MLICIGSMYERTSAGAQVSNFVLYMEGKLFGSDG